MACISRRNGNWRKSSRNHRVAGHSLHRYITRMALSPYIRDLRARVGSARLILPPVSVHIFDAVGRLLVIQQRDDGIWSTPGGCIEPDELPAHAARREAWEETGLARDHRTTAADA